jgi:type VI secretion system secreted protein Hcp
MRTTRPSPLSKTLALVPPAIALVAQHASGAFDAFIKIGSIDGEATDSKHPQWIELQSMQFGVSRAVSPPTSGSSNREASPPSISEIVITKQLDKASPALFLNAVGGSGTIATVTLELVDSATGQVMYRLTLNDVLVSSQSNSGAVGSENPAETISLNFAKIKMEYFVVDAKGSTAIPAVGYDLTTGKSFKS